jgi:SAM-dependent methyltransferase
VQIAVTEGARVLPTDRRPLELRQSGVWNGEAFQACFDALAADGVDVHGEAHFVTTLGPGSVLDAGCGTGRVAIELARRGIEVVGVDAESSMIATARQRAPELAWFVADLANLDLGRTFDVVIMAGNVPLFTRAGTQAALVAGCARHVSPGGALVCGVQLGRGYDLGTYDQQCAHAGLELIQRWSTWDREPFQQDGSYAVSVHSPRANQSADADRNEDSSTRYAELDRDLGLLPVNRVAAARAGSTKPRRKTSERRVEKTTHLETKTITFPDGTERKIELYARGGAVGIGELNETGDLHSIELTRARTHSHPRQVGEIPLVQRLPTPRGTVALSRDG